MQLACLYIHGQHASGRVRGFWSKKDEGSLCDNALFLCKTGMMLFMQVLCEWCDRFWLKFCNCAVMNGGPLVFLAELGLRYLDREICSTEECMRIHSSSKKPALDQLPRLCKELHQRQRLAIQAPPTSTQSRHQGPLTEPFFRTLPCD
jgi:hypothetical protein